MIRPSPCYSETFLSLGGGSVGHGASSRGAFAPKNGFWAEFHITSQGRQEHRTFIS